MMPHLKGQLFHGTGLIIQVKEMISFPLGLLHLKMLITGYLNFKKIYKNTMRA